MSLQFLVAGALYLVITVIALTTPAVRDVETILPDHEQAAPAGNGAAP